MELFAGLWTFESAGWPAHSRTLTRVFTHRCFACIAPAYSAQAVLRGGWSV